MSRVVPEGRDAYWTHTDEVRATQGSCDFRERVSSYRTQGYDDMPAHVKAAMFGSSLTLPIRAGRFALGTWQGIWLAEHRKEATPRSLLITLQGTTGSSS